jgi:hypothetical protein
METHRFVLFFLFHREEQFLVQSLVLDLKIAQLFSACSHYFTVLMFIARTFALLLFFFRGKLNYESEIIEFFC